MLEDTPVVLVVEGDVDRADLYAAWLHEEYTVRVAHDACAAIAALDEADAVVLGDDRPERVRTVLDAMDEREREVPTVAVTGEDGRADFGPTADERLDEPLSAEILRSAVSRLLVRRAYSRGIGELFAVASERAAIESDRTADGDRRRELDARLDELKERVDDTLDSLVERGGFAAAYRALDDESDYED